VQEGAQRVIGSVMDSGITCMLCGARMLDQTWVVLNDQSKATGHGDYW
jgi:hypothetical protein